MAIYRDYSNNNTNPGIVLSEQQACRVIANGETLYKRGLLTQRDLDVLKSETLLRTVPTLAVLGMTSQHADHLDSVVYDEPTDAEMAQVYGLVRFAAKSDALTSALSTV